MKIGAVLILIFVSACVSVPSGVFYSKDNDTHTDLRIEFINDTSLMFNYWSVYTDSLQQQYNYSIKRNFISIFKTEDEVNPVSFEFEPTENKLLNSIYIYEESTNEAIGFALIKVNNSYENFKYIGNGQYFITCCENLDSFSIEIGDHYLEFNDINLTSQQKLLISINILDAKTSFELPQNWRIKGRKLISIEGSKFILIKK